MRRKKNIIGALNRLVSSEQAFLRCGFLAPVTRGGAVEVEIEGVRMRLAVQPANFQGWAVFRPLSYTHCELIQSATASQRQCYLDQLAPVNLILCQKIARKWTGVLAAQSDGRFHIQGLAPIGLCDEGELFDTICTRFDGGRFWFDRLDARADPSIPRYLRQSLGEMLAPDKLHKAGLTAEQRVAYALCYRARVQKLLADAYYQGELRLREALAHAGAVLRDFAEQSDGYTVCYEIDGRRHTSFVSKDLTVQSAGICLSGQDRDFDLASLVGVHRQAANPRGRR